MKLLVNLGFMLVLLQVSVVLVGGFIYHLWVRRHQ